MCWVDGESASILFHFDVGILPLQLAHPILNSLKDTDKQWLVDLLYAFNAGMFILWVVLSGPFIQYCMKYIVYFRRFNENEGS